MVGTYICMLFWLRAGSTRLYTSSQVSGTGMPREVKMSVRIYMARKDMVSGRA